MKRQKFVPGAIVKIPLDETYHTYGRLLVRPYVAVYDYRTDADQADLQEIIKRAILFIVCVYDYAITKGRWEIIGKVSLDSDNVEVPPQFIQDSYAPYNCSLIDALGNLTPATIEECRGLERSAVWEPEHVEERIRDFYAGKVNRWAESLKLKE
jgi:hypothetical protein